MSSALPSQGPGPAVIELIQHGPEVGGLHRAGELLGMALRAAGYSVDTTFLPATGGGAPLPRGTHALRVAAVNADQFHRVPTLPGVPLVGWWSWELDRFRRSFVPAASGTTAIWTLSEHAARGLRAALDVPVRVLPLPVADAPARVEPSGGRFQVLVVADYASGIARKNPWASLRAYRAAFAPGDGARLVLKTSGAASHPGAARRLLALADRPDIDVIDQRMSRLGIEQLMASSDVLLSLHRAEGYSLPLAEAMSAGAVAVATAYGGPTDFMNVQNSVPVDFRLVRIGPGHWPYPPRACWADPDEHHAARAMRWLWTHVDARSALGARAARDMATQHSLSARVPLVQCLVAEVLRLGASTQGRRRPPRKGAGRWLAGGLHHADMLTRGRWSTPLAAHDRWLVGRLQRDDVGRAVGPPR